MSAGRPDRRSALRKFVVAASGLLTAAVAGLIGAAAAPASLRVARRWRRAASLFDLPPDAPFPAVLAERRADGWYATTRQEVVFIDREGDGYRALSATCQHLGCSVKWEAKKKQFQCPCHGGLYDREGRVVAGPPPRPLERLRVRVNPATSDVEVEL